MGKDMSGRRYEGAHMFCWPNDCYARELSMAVEQYGILVDRLTGVDGN